MVKAAKLLTKYHVRKAIEGSAGVMLNVSKKLNASYSTLHTFFNKPENMDLKALLLEEREKIVDVAENKLYKKVQEEDWNAVKYTLDKLGKKRGFDDTQKVQHFGEAGLKITFDNQDVKAIRDKNTIDCEAEIVLDETEGQDN